jgi:hypothetical protein
LSETEEKYDIDILTIPKPFPDEPLKIIYRFNKGVKEIKGRFVGIQDGLIIIDTGKHETIFPKENLIEMIHIEKEED